MLGWVLTLFAPASWWNNLTYLKGFMKFGCFEGPPLMKFWYCRSLIKVKFPTDQFRPALGSCCRLIVNHAQKTSKLPYFRLFRPDNQILSALTVLHWPCMAFYWPSITKYRQVPASTDPVLSYTDPLPSTNQRRPILTQYHKVSTSTAQYW